jgi:hypothetical protein
MKYLLLILGLTVFIFGLLQATHRKFQHWRYGQGRKIPVDINSEEYKTALVHMKINAGGLIVIGGVIILLALSK